MEHFFLNCSYIETFCNTIRTSFAKHGFDIKCNLNEDLIGYKIQNKEYADVNIILKFKLCNLYDLLMLYEK